MQRILWNIDDARNDPPIKSEVEAFTFLKTRRRHYLLALATFMGVPLVVSPLFPYLSDALKQVLGALVLAVCVPCWFYLATLMFRDVGGIPCPRCGENCFRRGIAATAFAPRCLNCGVPLYWRDEDLANAPDKIASAEQEQ